MIVIAIINTSHVHLSGDSADLVWNLFWQHVEACTAVIVVSLTAFRSIFIYNKRKPNKTKAKPGISQRFQIWLSLKKRSGADVQHLSPSPPVNQAPPHLTLGSSFRSNQQKALSDTRAQPPYESASLSHIGNLHEDAQHLGVLGTHIDCTDTSAVTDSETCEHQPGNEALSWNSSQGTGQERRGHWWQVGIISGFTLSGSKGLDSEV